MKKISKPSWVRVKKNKKTLAHVPSRNEYDEREPNRNLINKKLPNLLRDWQKKTERLNNEKLSNLCGIDGEKLKDWPIKNFLTLEESGREKLKKSWLTHSSSERYTEKKPIYHDHALVIENQEIESEMLSSEASTLYSPSLPSPLSILAGTSLFIPATSL